MGMNGVNYVPSAQAGGSTVAVMQDENLNGFGFSGAWGQALQGIPYGAVGGTPTMPADAPAQVAASTFKFGSAAFMAWVALGIILVLTHTLTLEIQE